MSLKERCREAIERHERTLSEHRASVIVRIASQHLGLNLTLEEARVLWTEFGVDQAIGPDSVRHAVERYARKDERNPFVEPSLHKVSSDPFLIRGGRER